MQTPYYTIIDRTLNKDVIKVYSRERAERIAQYQHKKTGHTYNIYKFSHAWSNRLVWSVSEYPVESPK